VLLVHPLANTTHLLNCIQMNQPAPGNAKAKKHLGKVVFKPKFFNILN